MIILLSPTYTLADDNEDYINSEISKLNEFLSTCKFLPGEIYLDDDTITIKILSFRRKDRVNKYLFCITRSLNNSVIVFSANEVPGYKIEDNVYIKHVSNDEHYFIHKIKSGVVDLYMREGAPSDNRFLYYLAKSNSTNYYIINPYENNIKEYKMPNPRSGNRNATATYLQD